MLDTRATLEIGAESVDAEVAVTQVELERGWKHRRCDREALLLIAPEDGALSLWGCGLRGDLDVYWIRDAQVVRKSTLAPCEEPCGSCPVLDPGETVDAALEVPRGALDVSPGDAVDGLAPWLPGAHTL